MTASDYHIDKMSNKRKRDIGPNTEAIVTEKPLSAIAAARLRSEAAVKSNAVSAATSPSALTLSPIPQQESEQSFGEQKPTSIEPDHTPVEHESDTDESLAPTRRVKLCNWNHVSENIQTETETELIVALKKHATIALVGCFEFRVLKGAINISGANISTYWRSGQKSRSYRVYTPVTHPILKIRGLDDISHVQLLDCPNPFAELSSSFAGIWNPPSASRSFSIVTDSDSDPLGRLLRPEVSPESWLRTIEDCVANPSTTLVVGTTSHGKSTYARRLLNRCLTGFGKASIALPAVYYLDLDPYKPDFTPSGQISLILVKDIVLSPSFANVVTGSSKNNIIRAHPIPLEMENYEEYYESCVYNLLSTFKYIPTHETTNRLIINTPGMMYVARFKLVTNLIARVKPSNIVLLNDIDSVDTEAAIKILSIQNSATQYRSTMREIVAQKPAPTALRGDTELQAMQFQAYFQHDPAESKPLPAARIPEALIHQAPLEFCYEETESRMQDFVGFASYSEPTESCSLLDILNGATVHIVETTSSTVPSPYTDLPRTNRYRIPYFPACEQTGIVRPFDPRTSRLICLGVISGFDRTRRVVQVLIPQSAESDLGGLTAERIVFIVGCGLIPTWVNVEAADTRKGQQIASERDRHGIWVEKTDAFEDMGYLNTVRRVRKFQI